MLTRHSLKPDGEAIRQELLVSVRLRNQTAASGNNKSRVRAQQIVKTAALETAKSALAIEIEDHAQRNAACLLDEAVEFEERQVQFFRKNLSYGGFACATKADKCDSLMTIALVLP